MMTRSCSFPTHARPLKSRTSTLLKQWAPAHLSDQDGGVDALAPTNSKPLEDLRRHQPAPSPRESPHQRVNACAPRCPIPLTYDLAPPPVEVRRTEAEQQPSHRLGERWRPGTRVAASTCPVPRPPRPRPPRTMFGREAREQVRSHLERLGPLGHVADRDVRRAEEACLLLDRAAVREDASASRSSRTKSKNPRGSRNRRPDRSMSMPNRSISRAGSRMQRAHDRQAVRSVETSERIDQAAQTTLVVHVLRPMHRHEEEPPRLETEPASRTSLASICGS